MARADLVVRLLIVGSILVSLFPPALVWASPAASPFIKPKSRRQRQRRLRRWG